MTTKQKLINFILFQALWFVLVLSGASGNWIWAYLATLIVVIVHFWWLSTNRFRDLKLLVFVIIWGFFIDSLLALLGFMRFTSGYGGGLSLLSPPWMVMLWIGFSTMLYGSVEWLGKYRFLQIIFGLIGGPLAYWAGERLGALSLVDPNWAAFVGVGMIWAISTPLLYHVGEWAGGSAKPKESEQ